MPHKVHDNLFKIVFGDHTLFAQFLRDFIAIDILKNVQPEDIEDIDTRYIPLDRENRDSDTVKRVNLTGYPPIFVIAITEHESKVNYRAAFKMLFTSRWRWTLMRKSAINNGKRRTQIVKPRG